MPSPTKKTFYIPSLDGIRALAFILVFLAHAGLSRLIPGGLGVTIFFFLSGYLITTLLRKEFEQTGTIHLGQFYLRRILRIFPPFYLTLTLLTIATMAGLLPGGVAVRPIAAQAAFLTNYYQIFVDPMPMWPPGSEVFWSLAVEEHFYILFPFLAIFLFGGLKSRGQALILGLACLGFLAWRCLLVFVFHEAEFRTYSASDTRMDSILFGCVLALWNNPAIDPRPRLSNLTKSLILGAASGLLLFCLLYRDSRFRDTFRYSFQGIALLPLFYFAIAEPERPWFRWLNWSWVRFFGVLSYSLYLVHFSALKFVSWFLPQINPTGQGLLALMMSFLYAVTIYRCVERPLATIRKRLHSDRRPPADDPSGSDPGTPQDFVGTLREG